MLRKARELVLRLIDSRDRIPLLVFVVGQRCSLRCKNCGNFTPYLPQSDYSLEEVWFDLKRISVFFRICKLQIQGGEALLCTFLPQLLNRIRFLDIQEVQIATNGMHLLEPILIKAIKKARASIRISDYGVPGQRSAELSQQCERDKINNRIYRFVAGDGAWIDLGGNDERRKDDVESNITFNKCPFRNCLTLENGILARCSRATVAHFVQGYNERDSDFVNVRKISDMQLKDKINDYVRAPGFMEACRYCNGAQGPTIAPAVQIE